MNKNKAFRLHFIFNQDNCVMYSNFIIPYECENKDDFLCQVERSRDQCDVTLFFKLIRLC
ncbi:MAG: hypothetical protein ACJAQ1_001684 [Flavobacterium sp.]|jgi:hypothetical protein